MLKLVVPLSEEGWDEVKEEFILPETKTIQLEHSLISLSKWESKFHKPFLTKKEKTVEETIEYVKCMTLTQNVNDEVYRHLSQENIKQVNKYIKDPMTATWFSGDDSTKRGRLNGEQITAELIYYWMVALNIPFECQKWHLNKLLTLIRVCNVKNQPEKKRSKRESAAEYAALNAKRRKELNSKG